jgi:hypothetical protein
MKPGVAEPEDGPVRGVLPSEHAAEPVVSRKLSPKFSHKFATIGSLDLQL